MAARGVRRGVPGRGCDGAGNECAGRPGLAELPAEFAPLAVLSAVAQRRRVAVPPKTPAGLRLPARSGSLAGELETTAREDPMGMQQPKHVVIVGAGIVGLSSAWYLQEQGVRVTVVDRTGVSAGSSWGNAGWLTPALTLPLSEPSVLTYGLKAMFNPGSPLYIPPTTDASLLRFLAGFARHCTPGKWREAMKVFSEIGSTGLDAFAEITEGSNTVIEHTKPADPF